MSTGQRQGRDGSAATGPEPAVYVRIVGGLANQMFQYAAGYSLARRLGCPLKLDLSAFDTYTLHRYRLDLFAVDEPVATVSELAWFNPPKLARRMARMVPRPLRRRPGPATRAVYREPHFHFDPALFEQRPPILLDGYWQSPKYFAHLRGELTKHLAARPPLPEHGQAMLRKIAGDLAVSIHVRRGDYVSDPATAKVHGACSLDYYRRAVRIMQHLHPAAVFYIFSDDVAYVREAFDFCPDAIVVEGDPAEPEIDLTLMKACRHHIIANSSFSWWGAWLNEIGGQTVIAPRRWFSDERLHTTYTYDLFPNEWITLG